MSSINTPTPTIANEPNIAGCSNMAKNAPNAIVNTLVPSASINAKRKASSEIKVALAPVKKKAKNKEGLEKLDGAPNIARTKVTSHPVFKYLVTLQLDLSSCYDEMLEYLRATGRFNAIRGLTREGFSLELLNEHGKRDTFEGKDIISWAEYELDPLIGSDSNWGHHCFEDDEEWKQYYEEYVRIEKQANVLDVKLIFNNQEELYKEYHKITLEEELLLRK